MRLRTYATLWWLTGILFGLLAAFSAITALAGLLGAAQVNNFALLLAEAVGLGWAAGFASRRGLIARQRYLDATPPTNGTAFILLLRPFSNDNAILVKNPRRWRFPFGLSFYTLPEDVPLERALAETFRIPVRVLGGSVLGPSIVRSDDDHWKQEQQGLVSSAEFIVVVPSAGREVPWELSEIRRQGFLTKTLCLLPAGSANLSGTLFRDDVSERLESEGFEVPPIQETEATVWTYQESGQIAKIEQISGLNNRQLRQFVKQSGM